MKHIGILYGGQSSEHDVSVQSATAILAALDTSKYHIIPIVISRTGQWIPDVPPGTIPETHSSEKNRLAGFLEWRGTHPLDVIFPALHGPGGEDGSMQGLLEFLDIPYVGSGVLGSALGAHKEITKQLVAAAGIPVVPWITTTRRKFLNEYDQLVEQIAAQLQFPVFVKPISQGSSFGVSQVQKPSQLLPALELAATYDRSILVERAIPCRELECAVLGNDEPQASVIGEVNHQNAFFDYHTKYADETFRFLTPAPIDEATSTILRTYALRIFEVLGLRGLARIDFFLDRQTQQIYLNEINSLPGFTANSTYPQLWATSGIPFSELLDRLIDLALEGKQIS
jgi:D-alanine-D-alanine ligase